MDIIYKSIKELIPYEKNAKKHDAEQIKRIALSLDRYGWKQPVVIDKDNVIVVGHGRLLGAKKSQKWKNKPVPCVVTDDLTEEEIKEYRLADNKLNESGWDIELLDVELEDIEFDMSEFGFELPEEEKEIVEDEAPEVNEDAEPICQIGDIWQLGRHRLMCGDSTKAEDVEKLMDGERARLVLTDPPYGIGIVKVQNNGKIDGDKSFGATHGKHTKPPMGKVHGAKGKNAILESKEYMPIIGDETTEAAKKNYEIIKDISDNQILFGGNYFTDFLFPSRCWIVWDKENSGSFADAELAWTSFDRTVKLYHWLWNGLCRKGDRETEGRTRVHPTQKPVGMLAEILKDFSEEDDLILDCFGGSGSTLIACEQLDRQCRMMELSPHYCDVIIQRWENITGEKAVRL